MIGTFVMPQTKTTYSVPLRDYVEISWCPGAEEAALGGVEWGGAGKSELKRSRTKHKIHCMNFPPNLFLT